MAAFVPEPLLPGGSVTPLYPDGTPSLQADRAHEPETYNLGDYAPGDRINTVTNVHSPSFDMYPARGRSTGACAILVPGGGNRVLGVGGCTALVETLGAYGVATAILRCRLRSDGYDMSKDALQDTLRCVQLVREARSTPPPQGPGSDCTADICGGDGGEQGAEGWGLDPLRIGVVGFSAGATHT